MRIWSCTAAGPVKAAVVFLAFIPIGGTVTAQKLTGPNIELSESALVVASAPVLSNGSGTLRIESPTLGQFAGGRVVGASGIQLVSGTIPIPEPTARLQLGAGALGLILIDRRRRRMRLASSARETENS